MRILPHFNSEAVDCDLPVPDLATHAWPWPAPGPFRLGDEAHKRAFCRTLIDTFDPYRPALIDWRKLDSDVLRRLSSLPIWDIAVQLEDRGARRVRAYADAVSDPLVKKAVELNAYEEGRHRLVLASLVQAYGFELRPGAPYRAPSDPERAFMETGFGECVDSFLAFGFFEAARRSGYFPVELVDTFEPVVSEEGRHILFFVNWLAWRRRSMAWWRRPLFELKVAAAWTALALQRLALARTLGGGGADKRIYTIASRATKELGETLDVAELLDLCLAENDRRLGQYDPRLVRPTFVPGLARLARRLLRGRSRPKPGPAPACRQPT